MLTRVLTRKFGALHSLFGLLSPSSSGLIVGSYPPARPIPNHSPIERASEPVKLQTTALPNGVTVLTESTDFPSSVSIGVSIATGTRDEDLDHSGICFALKNTFLKTNTRTNEQLNYCMIQMDGGEFSMQYDQESLLYTGSFLAHNAYDFLQMTSDMVLDDKTVIDEEAAQWRADEYFKLQDLNKTPQNAIEDSWLTAAYGTKTLGMPLAGFQSKFQNIGYSHVNHFREHFATPDRMVVMATGIEHHEEFVEAVKPYFQHLTPTKAPHREAAKYLGGELRAFCDNPNTTIHLSFQAPSGSSASLFPLVILRTLIGEAKSNSVPSYNRAFTHILQKYPFITGVSHSHAAFTDSGNFGLNVTGPSSSAGKIADALTTELLDLTKVTDQEVERAKLKFQAWVTNNFNNPKYRMFKYAKGIRFNGAPRTLSEIFTKSSAVTGEQVRAVAKEILKTSPTLVVLGGDTHDVPSADRLHARLK